MTERQQGVFREEARFSQGLSSKFVVVLAHVCSHGTGWGRVSARDLAPFIYVLEAGSSEGQQRLRSWSYEQVHLWQIKLP